MAKPWAEVVKDPAYLALSPEDKERARIEYFNEVVAPRVDTSDLEAARAEFDADTRQEDSLASRLGGALERGYLTLKQSFPATGMRANAQILADIQKVEDRLARGEAPEAIPDAEDPYSVRWMSPEERQQLRDATLKAAGGQAERIAGYEVEKRAIPVDKDIQAALQAETWGDFWEAFKKKPLEFVLTVNAESLVTSAPGIIGAVLAGMAGGPAGVMAAMGANSFAIDYAQSVLRAMQEEGIDITDKDAVAAAVQNGELMERIGQRAFAHAAVVGTADAASGGVAGKTLVSPSMITSRTAREAANIAAQAPVQGALGAGGEAGGQIASGRDVAAGEVAAEFFGEMATTPAEVAAASVRGLRRQASADVEREVAEQVTAAPDIDSAIAAAEQASRGETLALPPARVIVSPEGTAATESELADLQARTVLPEPQPPGSGPAALPAPADRPRLPAPRTYVDATGNAATDVELTNERIRRDRIRRERERLGITPDIDRVISVVQQREAERAELQRELDRAFPMAPPEVLRVNRFLRLLAEHGGISREDAAAQGIDPAHFADTQSKQVFGKPLFPKEGGMTFDQAAEFMSQHGFGSENYSANEFLELLDRALRGNHIASRNQDVDDFNARMEAARAQYFEQMEAAGGIEIPEFDATPTELALSGYNKTDEATKNLSALFTLARQRMGSDAFDELLERIAIQNENITDDEFEAIIRQEIERYGQQATQAQPEAAAAHPGGGEDITPAGTVVAAPQGEGQAEGGVSGAGQSSLDFAGHGTAPTSSQPSGPSVARSETPAVPGVATPRDSAGSERQAAAGDTPTEAIQVTEQTAEKPGLREPGTETPPQGGVSVSRPRFTFKIKPHGGGFIIESDDGGGVVIEGRPRPMFAGAARVFPTEADARAYMREHGMSEADRRQDIERRKRVEEMTPEEMRRALLTDPLTGLPNRRAYDEAPKKAVQVAIDADNLKWVNDNLGHEAGNRLLQAIGQALQESGLEAYHFSGDEFWVQGDDQGALERGLESVRQRLDAAQIVAETPDGSTITKRGVHFSYGIGATPNEADQALNRAKQEREAKGLRAARGEEPPGVTRTAPGEQDQGDSPPTKEVARTETPSPEGVSASGTEVAMRGRDERLVPVSKRDDSDPIKILRSAGLTVTKTTTKNGNPVWEVKGTKREDTEMHALLKSLGGRWYGPKKVWSFYKGDPTTDIAARLAPKTTEAQTTTTEAPSTDQEVTAPAVEPPASAQVRLAEMVRDRLEQAIHDRQAMTWQDLFALADRAYGGTQAQGAYTSRDAYDAMELGVNLYLRSQGIFLNPLPKDTESATETIEFLRRVMDRLPTQTRRSEEQVALQQFSTPHMHAFLAAWVARVGRNDLVLEPSAGTGDLVVHALNADADVVANELAPRRAEALRVLVGADRVTSENAAHINAVLPHVRPTVVLMNPPFSADVNRVGRMDTSVGATHVEAALKSLKENGRLVAILGRGMALDRPAFRDWWRRIRQQYNVRAVIGISGREYAKYGTSFDNVLVVIDKTGPTTAEPVTGEVQRVEYALPMLREIRNDRIAPREREGAPPAGQAGPAGARPDAEPGRPVRAAPDGVRPDTGVGRPAPEEPGGREQRGGATAQPRSPEGAQVPADQRGGRAEPAAGVGTERHGAARPGEPAAVQPAGQARRDQSVGAEFESADPADNTDLTASVFETYRPTVVFRNAKDHPTRLAESAAMASIRPPKLTYRPNIPEDVIESGRLSNVQLEGIAYAGQAHQQTLPDGTRRGFFIGDGTGVGKGAQNAGIILDNWRQGRRKAVWVSENQKLANDAARDLKWVGMNPDKVLMLHADIKGDINAPEGVIFTTYDTLRSQSKEIKDEAGNVVKQSERRLDQLLNWLGPDFDGVIIFDESHNLGNSLDQKGTRGLKKASAKALAGVELQDKLPQARVVYASATGATEVENLAYADRLGLWGEGTAFADKADFINQIKAGGVAAMEVVAKDLKAMGVYVARSLAYQGPNPEDNVSYETLTHILTPEQEQVYNALAAAWQKVLANVDEALEATGVVDDNGKTLNSRAKSAALSAFWGSHQRFFNQVITAMQMPSVVADIEKKLAAGESAVLQLVNTNEAVQERRLAQAAAADLDLEDLDLTPRDILIQYVTKSFPTTKFETYTDEDGNERARPVTDSKGNPVQDPDAVARRDALLEELASIPVPEGVLEQLLNHFGSDKVAEITGRKRRLVRDKRTGKMVEEKRSDSRSNVEADEFMRGKRRILVFSDAGGTGRSYHADLRAANQQKRNHYLVQPGWRADKAMQGFGRTHRTNQKQAPHYILVTTNLKAQRRFLSSIARRLDQLGALTKGQRETGSQGLFSAEMNLENEYAVAALETLVSDAYSGRIPGLGFEVLQQQMGLNLTDQHGQLRQDINLTVPRFLNRLLSLNTDTMDVVFDAFFERLQANVEYARQAGTLDTGMETIKAHTIEKLEDKVVRGGEEAMGETHYVKLKLTNPTRKIGYDALPQGAIIARNRRSGKLYAFVPATAATDVKSGRVVNRMRRISQIGGDYITESEFHEKYERERGSDEQLRAAWEKEVAAAPATTSHELHLVTGALLPVWDRLGSARPRIKRARTTSGERILGREIPAAEVNDVLKALGVGVTAPQKSPAEFVRDVLERGDTLVLANGWQIARRRVSGEDRIEILNTRYEEKELLKQQGAFVELIAFKARYFIPLDRAADVLGRITASKPVVEVIPGGRAADDDARFSLDDAPAIRSAGIPASATVIQSYRNMEPVKALKDYRAAKSGDFEAAARLVRALVKPEHIEQARALGPDVIYLPAVALEASGHNQIPRMLAEYYAAQTGARTSVGEIVEINQPHHTGAGAMERLLARPLFDGPVQAGARYVIVDDVTTMGGTLAELANHVQAGGGQVVGVITLVNASRNARMPAARHQYREIERRYGDEIRELFGVEPAALTAAEATYILGFRDADSLRNRAAKAQRQRSERLRAKGLQEGEVTPGGSAFDLADEAASPFYSQMQRVLTERLPAAGPAEKLREQIQNMVNSGLFKREEWEWSGVDEWLAEQKGKVTKDKVLEFLRENEILVTEKILDHTETSFDEYTLPGGKNYRELLLTLPITLPKEFVWKEGRHPSRVKSAVFHIVRAEHAHTPLEHLEGRHLLYSGDTRQETLDAFRARYRYPGDGGVFRSSHWAEPNVIAHVRFNERTDTDGKRVLFIEEIQSDWAQKGKREGFAPKRRADTTGWSATPPEVTGAHRGLWVVRNAAGEQVAAVPAATEREAIEAAAREKYAVPTAPFVTKTDSWVSLAIKRMIRWAAENGFERIAWATGGQQADRYNLSHYVDQVEYRKNDDGTYDLEFWRNGRPETGLSQRNVSASKLPDFVGKDVADRIISDKGSESGQGEGWKYLEEEDLKIGGEGMIAFYDKIVPSIVNKYVKKWNSKVGQTYLAQDAETRLLANDNAQYAAAIGAAPVHAFDVTPAMRESALRGQPLFSLESGGQETSRGKGQETEEAQRIRAAVEKATGKAFAPGSFTTTVGVPDALSGLVNAVDRIFGKKVVFFRNHVRNRIAFNGFVAPGDANTIYLDIESRRPIPYVAGHELLHLLRKDHPDIYNRVYRLALEEFRPEAVGEFREQLERMRRNYGLRAPKEDLLHEEMLANFFGDNLADPAFWNRLAGKEPAIFERFAEIVRRFISRLLTYARARGYQSAKYFRDLERMRDAAAEALAEYARRETGVRTVKTTEIKSRGDLEEYFNRFDLDDLRTMGRGELIRRARELGVPIDPRQPTRDIRAALERASMQRPAPAAAPPPPAATEAPHPTSWNAPAPGKLDSVIYVLQDKHIDTKRVIQAIKNASGFLKESVDVYLKEELYHGRTAKRVQDFLDQELRPLLNEMSMRGVTMPELEEYLHARHAEERNAQIARVNPDMPDGGSGMTNAEAQEYLDGLDPKKRRTYEALAARVDGIIANTRQALVAYGLESPETIAAWEAAYEHYVPLQREDMDMGLGPGTGMGFSVRGPASRRATGSRREVIDILANIAMQRERAIVRGEKNRVARALVGLAAMNPNPDFWKVDRPPTEKVIDPQTGLVTLRVDPLYKSRPNVVVARIPNEAGNIVEHFVVFNQRNERAMRMAEALKNLDIQDMGEVLGFAAKITRYFASINTQYNPIFGIVNLIRDTQGAILNLSSTAIRGQETEVIKHVVSALRGIYIEARAARSGEQRRSTWADLWEEFQREGGQTGYRDLFKTSDERAKAIEREIKRVQEGKAKLFGRAVFDWLSDYNLAMENAVRLAAYKVAKETGLTNQRAASIAKNLTVNFNRRGQIGTQAGALYEFFNASMQGTARMIETLTGPAGKKIIFGGMLLGSLQALLLAAAGYEDEEPPEFVRERNVIIPIGGGRYITIPMPLGFHVIPNLGRIPTEFVLRGFRDPHERVMALVNVVADAFNPIGNAGLSIQTIAPTVIDPVAALAENKDWTGKPIAREDFNKLAPTPGHTRARDTASEFSKMTSKAINWLTGGTEYTPGIFSPTPDQIDYLIGQVTGGLGREIMKAEQTVTSAITGEELPAYKIPLAGRFYGTTEGQAPQGNAFYKNLRDLNMHEAEIKGRLKAGERIGDYYKEHPEARLIGYANKVERHVGELRRHRQDLIDKGASRDRVRLVDQRITSAMRRFNERVKEARAR